MLEPGLIAWDRRAQSDKTGCEYLDAIEVSARFFEGAIEFVFHPINCSVRGHSSPMFLPRGKDSRPGGGSYFRIIDRISINKM
jgi:hypothetical protein